MKVTLNIMLFAALLMAVSQGVAAQTAEMNTSIATMFARDPLTQSVCFKDGGPGSVFQAGQTRNRCSDLNFHSYTANNFSVGIEGGKLGVILDLGTPEDLKAKYGFTETVGNGQGFASINVKNGKAMILKDYKSGVMQDLAESADLFKAPSKSYSSIPVKLGHVYLMRVTDRNDKSFEMLAKFIVIAHVPNESVTVRWHVIGSNPAATAKLN